MGITKLPVGSYGPKRVDTVRLCRGMAHRVDEPSDNRGVNVLECLPVGERLDPARMLRTEPRPDLASIDRRWRMIGATQAGAAEYLSTYRAKNLWAFLPLDEVRA